MASIRNVYAALIRAGALTDYHICDNLTRQHELFQQTILADKSLTEEEKSTAMYLLNDQHDEDKVFYNEGEKRICENCQLECLATSYCEHCVRNYLKTKFSNWTSGNNDIDDLIQKCQIETLAPHNIIEWIPYNNLRNIKYLTKGGCSEIYTANWIDGYYIEWDSRVKQLKRSEVEHDVILKKLENVESANRSWFDEAKSHLTTSNRHTLSIVPCLGLTQNPSNGNYMLVIDKLDMNLRKYLQQNHNQLTWKDGILIIFHIIDALHFIHKEGAIHRDLHSGNVLYRQYNDFWYISDFGFCGPVDKPLGSIYGNLPYIAPEVIVGKEYTYASDIYSIGILMWEISTGQPPFANLDHNYYLAMDIVNGMRPKIEPGIPLKYKELMEQCWDADPNKRPDIKTVMSKMYEISKPYYQNKAVEGKFKNLVKNFFKLKSNNSLEVNKINSLNTNFTSSKVYTGTSKIYEFKNVSEPKNATEEEQEEFHSKYSFNIPDKFDDFNNSSNVNSFNASKSLFKNTQSSQKRENKRELIQQVKRQNTDTHDDINDEIHNNANLHSEDQDELEI